LYGDLAPRLKNLGFQGNPKAFADLTGMPMGAVISLGGCSASLVSPDGLILTNHHCVTGALQYNATPERNTVKEGFLAPTREEEAWAGPGSRVLVTVAVREVTREVTGKLAADLSDLQRGLAIEKRAKELTAACENEGLRWYEIAAVELKDVRLVHAPPTSIGNFGGETDNWRWPRHTGDFGFYRAYVGRDGKPAAFDRSKEPFVDPKLGDVPVNFLSDVDSTGGNSGSAVLNGKGKLVGLLFDGTYETIASDLLFDPVSTRSIQVDVRCVLWVTSQVSGATRVLSEMGIRP